MKTDVVHISRYYQNKVLYQTVYTLGETVVHNIGDVNNDYKRYVPKISNWLTTVGTRLLNDSIAGYVYSVLSAQAKIRASIVNQGAISLQCQDVFHKLVGDSIVSNDVVVGVSNMRKAVNDCNQVLNLAVSPDVFLLPSDMTILKERIPGYSNVLYRASEKSMKFGVNSKVNYSEKSVASQPPRQTSGQVVKETKASVVRRSDHGHTTSKNNKVTTRPLSTKWDNTHTSELLTALLLSAAGTFLVVKYVL